MQLKHFTAAILAGLALWSGNAAAVGTFIPATQRIDMVHDAKRGLVYISDGNYIRRYQLESQTFLEPVWMPGRVRGMDLSPDGNRLAVADDFSEGGFARAYVVNLDSLGATGYATPLTFGEAGLFTVAFADDNTLLTTSRYNGSGWVPMRRLALPGGQPTDVASVRQDTMLASSGDGGTIAFAESNSSAGPWGLYDVPTAQLAYQSGFGGTGAFNFEVATDRLGGQFAIPTYFGTYIYNEAYTKVATIGQYAGPQPIGVAYHPVEDRLYLPWSGGGEVKVYDSRTFSEVGTYDFEDSFVHTGNRAFGQGRTKLSRDGSLLMVSVTGGVRVHRMYAPLAAADVVTASNAGAPVTVALSGSIGNGGALTYAIATQPAHGSATVSGDQVTYVPTPGHVGVDSFRYRVSYGRASVEATVAVTTIAPNSPPVAVDDSYTTRLPSVSLPVLSNDTDVDGDELSLVAVSQPARGRVSISGTRVIYTAPRGFIGTERFYYSVSDGQGGTAKAQVTVRKLW